MCRRKNTPHFELVINCGFFVAIQRRTCYVRTWTIKGWGNLRSKNKSTTSLSVWNYLHPWKSIQLFHVLLLNMHKKSNLPSWREPPSTTVEVDDHVEFEVEEVLNSKIRHRKLEYLVHWHEYNINDSRWEPTNHLANAQMKVCEFHRRHPSKPKAVIYEIVTC